MITIKCGGREVFRTVLSEQDTPLNLADFTEFVVEKLKEELALPMYKTLDKRLVKSFLESNRKRIAETVEEILSNPSEHQDIGGMAFPSILHFDEEPFAVYIHCKCDNTKVYAVYIEVVGREVKEGKDNDQTNCYMCYNPRLKSQEPQTDVWGSFSVNI